MDILDRTRFTELMHRWSDDTVHISSTTRIADHLACREIVAMGDVAVPLVLGELENRTSIQGLVALKAITGTEIRSRPRPEATSLGWPKLGWTGVASMDIGGELPGSRAFPALGPGNHRITS